MPVQSKADMDPNFEDRLGELTQQSLTEYTQRSSGNQVPWARPGFYRDPNNNVVNWPGDLFDIEGMSLPFLRTMANQYFINAVSDAENPGTTGDLVATTSMVDFLANMERAFRMRFMRRPRAIAHMLGRKQGHGNQQGVFIQNALEYIRTLLQLAKQAQP